MSESSQLDHALSRRNFLAVGGTAAAAAAAGVSLANPGPLALDQAPAANRKLARAAVDCVHRGQLCLQHGLASLRAGNPELADCAGRVQELVLSCGALSRLAINGSRQVALMACAVREIAADCEGLCRRHRGHQPFVAFADACAALHGECDALVA